MSGLIMGGLLEIFKAAGINNKTLYTTIETMESAELVLMLGRLALVGLVAFMARKHVPQFLTWLCDSLFHSVLIPASDPAFQWVRAWVAQDTRITGSLRQVQLDTMDSRRAARKAHVFKSKGLSMSRFHPTWIFGDIHAQIVPPTGVKLWYREGMRILWMKQSLFASEAHHLKPGSTPSVRLITFAWQRDFLREFLQRAHAVFYDREDEEILIFRQSIKDLRPCFKLPQYRPARPLSSVVLPADVKERLLGDIRDFLSADTRAWYGNRGIPHRRGYLLHGIPGSGETSLALAIASHFKLDIYVISPADRGMDDSMLASLFTTCPQRSMILIEDIDVAMPVNRDLENAAFDQQLEEVTTSSRQIRSSALSGLTSHVTLSGMLNAIDGVTSQENCLLFATTNHLNRLDHALKRPGRLDYHVEFLPAVQDQVEEMFNQFYTMNASSKHVNDKRRDNAKAFADILFGGHLTPSGSQTDQDEAAANMEEPVVFSMAQVQGLLLQNKADPAAAVASAPAWRAELYAKALSARSAALDKQLRQNEKRQRQKQLNASELSTLSIDAVDIQ